MPDLLARRAGRDYDGDLLGAGVIALVLLAMPLVRPEASAVAGGVGVVVRLPRRPRARPPPRQLTAASPPVRPPYDGAMAQTQAHLHRR